MQLLKTESYNLKSYGVQGSSIDTVVVYRVCCAYVGELFVYYSIYLFIYLLILMSVMYVKINVIIVRQESI